MGKTTIQVTDNLADRLHGRKGRGDTYEDVIERVLDVPNEYRLVCDECGLDGGSYDYRSVDDEPAYCPYCGSEIEPIPAEREPTALSWEPER